MIDRRALDRITTIDAALAARFFDNPQSYVWNALPRGWSSTRAVSFKSYALFGQAVAGGTLVPGVRAVIYDPEHWSLTPLDEQENPAFYEKAFVSLAHAHGLAAIVTPAADLVVVQPGYVPTKSIYAQYLSMGFPTFSARSGADIYEIQAQGLENDTAAYRNFVVSATLQARQIQPLLTLAGLSTGPDGQFTTGVRLYADSVEVEKSVSGFWMNIPTTSIECPKCGLSDPQVAVDFLQLLGTQPNLVSQQE